MKISNSNQNKPILVDPVYLDAIVVEGQQDGTIVYEGLNLFMCEEA
jgi:hypothetical protein